MKDIVNIAIGIACTAPIPIFAIFAIFVFIQRRRLKMEEERRDVPTRSLIDCLNDVRVLQGKNQFRYRINPDIFPSWGEHRIIGDLGGEDQIVFQLLLSRLSVYNEGNVYNEYLHIRHKGFRVWRARIVAGKLVEIRCGLEKISIATIKDSELDALWGIYEAFHEADRIRQSECA